MKTEIKRFEEISQAKDKHRMDKDAINAYHEDLKTYRIAVFNHDRWQRTQSLTREKLNVIQ